jgi:hypothetical protein
MGKDMYVKSGKKAGAAPRGARKQVGRQEGTPPKKAGGKKPKKDDGKKS